jgi:hypothetical protein
VHRSAGAQQRRAVHLALTDVTDCHIDPDRRAWHLAAAATGPDEGVASKLEHSAGRAQARGGLAAAAAFLQRSVALTGDPARRVDRALAARANLYAGAFDTALMMLVIADAGSPDELQRARTELLRAQIAFSSTIGSDAPPLLVSAARRLERLDPELARETYLDAWGAAMFAGRLATAGGLLEISRAARAAPAPARTPHPADLLLDALALLITGGRTAAAPALRRASEAFAAADDPAENRFRWTWLPPVPCYVLWDDEGWYAINARQLQLARDAGALARVPMGLITQAVIDAWSGDFTAAAAATAEAEAITEATGIRIAPYGAMRSAWPPRTGTEPGRRRTAAPGRWPRPATGTKPRPPARTPPPATAPRRLLAGPRAGRWPGRPRRRAPSRPRISSLPPRSSVSRASSLFRCQLDWSWHPRSRPAALIAPMEPPGRRWQLPPGVLVCRVQDPVGEQPRPVTGPGGQAGAPGAGAGHRPGQRDAQRVRRSLCRGSEPAQNGCQSAGLSYGTAIMGAVDSSHYSLVIAAAHAAGPCAPGAEAAWGRRVRGLTVDLHLIAQQARQDIERLESARTFIAFLEKVEIEESSRRGLLTLRLPSGESEPIRTEQENTDRGRALIERARSLAGRWVLVYRYNEQKTGQRIQSVRMLAHLMDLGADGAVPSTTAKKMVLQEAAGDTARAQEAWAAAGLPGTGPVSVGQIEQARAAARKAR